jgi:hypothetical protein
MVPWSGVFYLSEPPSALSGANVDGGKRGGTVGRDMVGYWVEKDSQVVFPSAASRLPCLLESIASVVP